MSDEVKKRLALHPEQSMSTVENEDVETTIDLKYTTVGMLDDEDLPILLGSC